MRDLPNSKVIQQVEDVLVAERALLVSGDFKALERLEVDKEKVIAAIRPMSEKDLQELRHLRGLAEHNQQLFKQALKGIQDVSDRLESIRKVGETIDTYDHTGRRVSVETQQSKKGFLLSRWESVSSPQHDYPGTTVNGNTVGKGNSQELRSRPSLFFFL